MEEGDNDFRDALIILDSPRNGIRGFSHVVHGGPERLHAMGDFRGDFLDILRDGGNFLKGRIHLLAIPFNQLMDFGDRFVKLVKDHDQIPDCQGASGPQNQHANVFNGKGDFRAHNHPPVSFSVFRISNPIGLPIDLHRAGLNQKGAVHHGDDEVRVRDDEGCAFHPIDHLNGCKLSEALTVE